MSGTNFNLVLVEPEIPNNTGNIGRMCVGFDCHLHLIEPLGFEISDRTLKRAGLDYWQHLYWTLHANFDKWFDSVPDKSRVFFFTTKTTRSYHDTEFKLGDYFVFGKETKGLPEPLLSKYPQQTLTVPFSGQIRSFNLANATAMVLSEAVRQNRAQIFSP